VKQKLDSSKFSTIKSIQDLLASLSARRITLQHISAKLSSLVLTMVDFAIRNPVPHPPTQSARKPKTATPHSLAE
jgi:hypothetical protein